MSQRNPMNERYTTDAHTGVTRKSAGSAKPKRQAAATVVTQTSKKTPQQKKAEMKAARKEEQKRQRELDAKYYKPDTAQYKKLRRTWWLALIGAVVCVAASWALRSVQPEWLAMVTLFLAYALIIFAFYIDFSKIRKERKLYQARMVALEAEAEKAEKQKARLEAGKQQKKGSKPKGSGKNASRNPNVQAKAAAKNAADKEAESAKNAGESDKAEGKTDTSDKTEKAKAE